jgi:plasmid stabilization system protein ParE
MSLFVVFVPEARAQLLSADQWWRENGADPDLLEREVASAVALLIAHPEAGARFLRARQPGVRRLLLRETQHHLYYRVERDRGVIRILALWHTARGRGLRLR